MENYIYVKLKTKDNKILNLHLSDEEDVKDALITIYQVLKIKNLDIKEIKFKEINIDE